MGFILVCMGIGGIILFAMIINAHEQIRELQRGVDRQQGAPPVCQPTSPVTVTRVSHESSMAALDYKLYTAQVKDIEHRCDVHTNRLNEYRRQFQFLVDHLNLEPAFEETVQKGDLIGFKKKGKK